MTNQVTRDLSNETISAYIDKFCRDNPLKHITTAVFFLICETREGMAKPFDFCDTADPSGPKRRHPRGAGAEDSDRIRTYRPKYESAAGRRAP